MRQQGIALLTGLLLLAAISLLAIASASGTILQKHLAANFQDELLALENADVADAWARAWLFSRPDSDRQSGCETGCVLPPGVVPADQLPERPEFESAAWWEANAEEAGVNPDTGEAFGLPWAGTEPSRWLIAELHYEATGDAPGEDSAEGVAWYRILSRGIGRQAGSVRVTESIAARPWEGEFPANEFPPQGSSRSFCETFEGRYPCGRLSWRRRR